MEIKRFERVFLLFTREDEEINGGQSPSGYVKLDNVQGRVKLTTTIQGLREYYGKDLILCLFCKGYEKVRFFNAGKMTFKQSKYELTRDIILDSSNGVFTALKNVDGAVIVGIENTNRAPKVFCPLVAFKNNKRFDYKEELARVLLQQKETPKIEVVEVREKELPLQEKILEEGPMEPLLTSFKEEEGNKIQTSLKVEEIKEILEKDKNIEAEETSEFELYQNMLRQLGLSGVQDEHNKICMEPTSEVQKEICEDCKITNREVKERGIQPLNVAKLRLLFNKCFEPYDPFRLKRQDYRWWKVGSPVQLNNLLYQNNIKTPLLFNPQLMMAHFKYRHILVGTYCNIRHRKEYVVCGVPAIYNIDEKPFGEYCRWAQLESTKPRHGAFGYWLVYIDIKTGNFLGL